MIYYDSKYLSRKLGINPAKWKRWAREFLPPDPLGGLHSGVARQFNLKEAFKVYLGGYLVSELKLTIPEAVQILDDLSAWLKSNGFFAIQPQNRPVQQHHIYIYVMPNRSFTYCIRTIRSLLPTANNLMQETFSSALIPAETDPAVSADAKSAHLLSITAFHDDFISRIG